MELVLAAMRLLEGLLGVLKALLELLRSGSKKEVHPARRSRPKHLNGKRRRS